MLMCAGFLYAAGNNPQWALAKVPVVCVRENPGHAAELGTQVVMGTPLKVTPSGRMSGWYDVETPDGYRGSVIANSLALLSDLDFRRWKQSDRVVVTSVDQAYIHSEPEPGIRNRVSEVVNGTVLRRLTTLGDWVKVEMPDGRSGYIPASELCEIDLFASKDFDLAGAIDMAYAMMGSPYLWGGTSTKSVDCSGLTKVAWLSQGVVLPRNASAQAKVGMPVEVGRPDRFEPGDLLFFGNRSTRRVNHVGIYLGDGKFIHCSGRVRINSLDPKADDYMKLYLLSVSRFGEDDLRRMSMRNSEFFF